MQADGITTGQVTDEEAGVDSFAVSPLDGGLAFVTANQLFLMDGDGTDRRLIADDSQLDEDEKGTYFYGLIGAPVFSPDGQTLAYALDGLHLYDLAIEDSCSNLGNLLGNHSCSPRLYNCGLVAGWQHVAVQHGLLRGQHLAVWSPGEGSSEGCGPAGRCVVSTAGPRTAARCWSPTRTFQWTNRGCGAMTPKLGRKPRWLEACGKMAGWTSLPRPSSWIPATCCSYVEQMVDPDVGIPMVLVRMISWVKHNAGPSEC
jgi:hypothetical protein